MPGTVPTLREQADNRAALQDAIDAVHAQGGGAVTVGPGRWPLGGPLLLRDQVTLGGVGMLASVLCPLDGAEDVGLRGPGGLLEGATVEELTLDRVPIAFDDGATFCALRRLRLRDLPGAAVSLSGATLDHLYLEQLVIEGCGGDGIVFAPSRESTAVFLTEVSVRDFGADAATAVGAAGVRLAGRAFISQLHVEPVRPGNIGLALEPGSDHTVASNLFFAVEGGIARRTTAGVQGVAVEAELVRDLTDPDLTRVFP